MVLIIYRTQIIGMKETWWKCL